MTLMWLTFLEVGSSCFWNSIFLHLSNSISILSSSFFFRNFSPSYLLMKGMKTSSVSKLLISFFTALVVCSKLIRCCVVYDDNAVLVNGQWKILILDSISLSQKLPEVIVFHSLLLFSFWKHKKMNWFFGCFHGCRCGRRKIL